jgi:hypothetical protein
MTPTSDITIITLAPEGTTMLSKLQTLTRTIERMRYEQHKLARELPPVRFTDLCSDGNVTDRAFEVSVRAWMSQNMNPIDTTLLDREGEDSEKWELLTPRYTLREDLSGWQILDHDLGGFVTLEDDDGNENTLVFEEEWEAQEKRDELEDENINALAAFPFAWNTGWVLEGTYWLAEFQAAGFLVYRYDGDAIIAGIDGGGYSFMGAHFAPLYAALAAKNDWLVETDDGPRRITMSRE